MNCIQVGARACPIFLHEVELGQSESIAHWPRQTSEIIDVLKSTIGTVNQVSFVGGDKGGLHRLKFGFEKSTIEIASADTSHPRHGCLLLALECTIALRRQHESERQLPAFGIEVKTPILLPFLGRLSRVVVPGAVIKSVILGSPVDSHAS